jgi:WD40 repeat protein
VLGRHVGSVKSLAALPGQRWLSGGRDGCLRLHGPDGGAAILVGRTIVNGVAASADGRRAACVSRSCGVELFDLVSGRRIASQRDHRSSARAVALSPDGARVAAGYYDGHLLVWSPATGAAKLTRPFGATPLSSVAFAPDGSELVVAAWDAAGHFGRVDAASGELRSESSVAGCWT